MKAAVWGLQGHAAVSKHNFDDIRNGKLDNMLESQCRFITTYFSS